MPMNATPTPERAYLDAGVAKIAPKLAKHGFTYLPGDTATSSGGPFAVGFFRRGDLEIGLIVRSRRVLGCPNYSVGKGYVAHDRLMAALGAQSQEKLAPGPWPAYVASDDGDVFLALAADIEQFVIPALHRSEQDFRAALSEAVRAHQDQLRSRQGKGHSA